MLKKEIAIISLSQLKDNYSYLVLRNKKVIIVDPAESTQIIQYIKNNQLNLIAILLTHHHLDHTAGVKKFQKIFLFLFTVQIKTLNIQQMLLKMEI